MDLGLTEKQRATVAAAVTILGAVVILAAVSALFWLLAIFVHKFSNVFLPLAVAGVAALVLKPYYQGIRRRLKAPKSVAVALVFLSVVLPVTAFLWFFGALLVAQISDLVARIPDWWHAGVEQVEARWPQVVEYVQNSPILSRIPAAVEGQRENLVQGLQMVGTKALSAGAGVLRAVGTVLAWAVLPVYFAFFLAAEPKGVNDPAALLPFLKPETRQDLVYLVREFVSIIVAFFRGQLIIAFLQGLLFAIGFSIVGLKYGFVLGLVLGFLNIIPYLGNIVGLGIALPLSFFQPGGGLVRLGLVLVVFALVQMIEGYLLTPKIMGDRTGLHPMAIIVAIFFWGTALGGIMGMIMAIPLTAFLVVFWRLAKEKYVTELV